MCDENRGQAEFNLTVCYPTDVDDCQVSRSVEFDSQRELTAMPQ